MVARDVGRHNGLASVRQAANHCEVERQQPAGLRPHDALQHPRCKGGLQRGRREYRHRKKDLIWVLIWSDLFARPHLVHRRMLARHLP